MQTAIKVENLRRTYGENTVVNSISFEVEFSIVAVTLFAYFVCYGLYKAKKADK